MRAQAGNGLDALLTNRVVQLDIDVPAGAAIIIDGRRAARGDGPMLVLPGKHDVAATLDGKTELRVVECKLGAINTVTLHGGIAGK
jgi:hypothetical protein